MLTKDIKNSKVLYVFGFRKQESSSRAKKEVLKANSQLTTKSRQVWDWLPIQGWTTKQVWEVIKANKLPYHYAYDLGMPRLSCMFCIFSPFDALVIAGKHNYQMLEEYVKVEHEIQHTFRNGFSIASVKEAIDNGYEPKQVPDWVM
jgi:3'-phosphoadenosine 5'-phosphosulfate sulfotransferase (PAPS reductase)/FAD synthetase